MILSNSMLSHVEKGWKAVHDNFMMAHWHTGAVSGLQEGLSSIVISNHFIALSDVFILFILTLILISD